MAERVVALPKPDAAETVEEALAEVTEIKHMLHLLVGDLDFGLDPKRAIATRDSIVTLNFNNDSLEATHWLAGEAWKRASDLADKLLRVTNAQV
jgi:hypothetical protein